MVIDVLVFIGYKSLYGLVGIGGLVFSEWGVEVVKLLMVGGIGSYFNFFD